MEVSGLDAWLTDAAHANLRLKRLTRKEGPLASWPRMTRMVRHGHLSLRSRIFREIMVVAAATVLGI